MNERPRIFTERLRKTEERSGGWKRKDQINENKQMIASKEK